MILGCVIVMPVSVLGIAMGIMIVMMAMFAVSVNVILVLGQILFLLGE